MGNKSEFGFFSIFCFFFSLKKTELGLSSQKFEDEDKTLRLKSEFFGEGFSGSNHLP